MGITGKPQKNKNSQERRVTLAPARSVSPLSETQQSNKPKGSRPNTNKYIPGDKGRWSIASCLTCNVQITSTYGIDVPQEKKPTWKRGDACGNVKHVHSDGSAKMASQNPIAWTDNNLFGLLNWGARGSESAQSPLRCASSSQILSSPRSSEDQRVIAQRQRKSEGPPPEAPHRENEPPSSRL